MIALLIILAQPSTLNLNQNPIVSRQNGGRLSNTRQYAIDCRSGMSCSVDGGVLLMSASSSGAPSDATYITQTPNATLTNEQPLSTLATGLVINTTGTGVLSAYAGSTCTAGQYATAAGASGALTCSQVATSQLSGTISDAQLASSYSGVGACGANTFATTLNDNASPTVDAALAHVSQAEQSLLDVRRVATRFAIHLDAEDGKRDFSDERLYSEVCAELARRKL